MSKFKEWATSHYMGKPSYERELEEAYNAGMKRAAEIVKDHPLPYSRGIIAETIRKELDNE